MNLFQGYLPQLLTGAWITVQVACCSLLLGLLLGLLGASAEASRFRVIRYFATSVISVIRGLPELLVLFFIYFGGTLLLTSLMKHYVDVSAFWAGVVALGLLFGSYASQVFRAAFLAVPAGQIEAAKALGLKRWLIFSHIQLPQAWRHALPGLGNLWLVLLKDTALVSLIGLSDLMNKAQLASSSTRLPFTFFLTAAVFYLLLTSISQGIMRQLAQRATRHLNT
ncbi:MAG: ABC transporter permease subunit [Gammaproteobacteria bacterium]